jgi:hypothetical protein
MDQTSKHQINERHLHRANGPELSDVRQIRVNHATLLEGDAASGIDGAHYCAIRGTTRGPFPRHFCLLGSRTTGERLRHRLVPSLLRLPLTLLRQLAEYRHEHSFPARFRRPPVSGQPQPLQAEFSAPKGMNRSP